MLVSGDEWTMLRGMYRFLGLLAALALSACSPLRTFNALVPKDPGVPRVAKDQAFGPGSRGRLDLYAPAGAKGPLPVIVFFYGGSWKEGDKESYGWVARALAAQGFLVAVPDYRLVPAVRFPTFLEDGAAAVKWVRANAGRFGGDPERIVLSGHSAGAYNAAMLALDPRWLGADRSAVRGWIGIAGPYSFLPLDVEVTRNAFGRAADLPATQPINFASADDPASLLLVAGKDTLVGPRSSDELQAALRRAGAPVETRVYPNVDHSGILAAVARPFRGQAPVLPDVAAFARQVTQAEAVRPAR